MYKCEACDRALATQADNHLNMWFCDDCYSKFNTRMKCEYPLCKNRAKYADTILNGFTCDKHFSMLDVHDKPKQYEDEMAKIRRLELRKLFKPAVGIIREKGGEK